MGDNAAHKVGPRYPFAALNELDLVAKRLHAHTYTHAHTPVLVPWEHRQTGVRCCRRPV